MSLALYLIAAAVAYVFYLFVRMIRSRGAGSVPNKVASVYSLVLPGDLLGQFLPRIPFVNEIPQNPFHEAAENLFNKTGCDTICVVGPYRSHYISRSLEFSKDVFLTKRKEVGKALEFYQVLNFFGKSVLTLDGKEWLRHRTVIQPAFSDANLRFVAECSAEFANAMMSKWEANGLKAIDADPEFIGVTMKIISKAGFGLSELTFDKDHKDTSGKMPLSEAIKVVSEEMLPKLILPDYILRNFPSAKLKRVSEGFDVFGDFLHDVIRNRKEGNYSDGKDLMNLLLQANESDAQHHLSDEEIAANTFIFLFAGHETTAHTLLWAFNLLAMHPDLQEKAYQEVVAILGEDRDPNYDDYRNLTYIEAIMRETLRMYPPVCHIPKIATEDVIIDGIPIPKGVHLDISSYALSPNPKYWSNPESFDPGRFDERISKPVDPNLFTAFSRGPRGCIGFRFALIEGTLILAMLIRRFKFAHPKRADFAALLRGHSVLSLKPNFDVKLELEPRRPLHGIEVIPH